MIAGGEELRRGPVPVALAWAGYALCAVWTPEQAEGCLADVGPGGCVLVVDAASLERAAGFGVWPRFLARRPRLPAVIVARSEVTAAARAAADGPGRILLADAFDAADVVAAATRASSGLCHGPLCSARGLRQAG